MISPFNTVFFTIDRFYAQSYVPFLALLDRNDEAILNRSEDYILVRWV